MIHYYRHNRRLYREALTPQQKQLKRQYRLEQQQQADQIPTLEEVIEGHANQIEDRADAYVEMFSDESFDEDDMVGTIQEIAGIDDWADLSDEQQERMWSRHQDYAQELLVLEHAKAYVEEEVAQEYWNAVQRVEGQLEGVDCWRAINLVQSIDPAQHEGLNIYWAFDQDGAEPYDGGAGDTHIYHARVDLENVDKAGTIWANTYPSIGEDEAEVRFYQGAPIYVYDVELPDGTVLEINDWRRC